MLKKLYVLCLTVMTIYGAYFVYDTENTLHGSVSVYMDPVR